MSNQNAGLPTREFAHHAGVQPHSVRVRLSETGSYFGIKPSRLPNGRWVWPSDSPERLRAIGQRTRGREIRRSEK